MTTTSVKEVTKNGPVKECSVFFRRYYDGTEIKLKIPHADSAIPEMVDSFLDFLRACGYIDPEQAVLEKMLEYAEEGGDTIKVYKSSVPKNVPKEVSNETKKRF